MVMDVDKETGEILEGRALAVRESTALRAAPHEVFQAAHRASLVLTKLVEQQKLYNVIGGRKHVRLEGWTSLGALCGPILGDGVFPVTAWSRPIPGGFEARVEVRTYSGQLVGAAEAQCTRSEKTWKDRDDYALRSMAQTRAASKALRIPLGWIMQLAGFEATPAEEMEEERRKQRPQPQPALHKERYIPPMKPDATPPAEGNEDRDRGICFGWAAKWWPENDNHVAVCIALNLPETGEGAIREYWLGLGGTWKEAQAALAEVRRLETQHHVLLFVAAEQVNAYGRLLERTSLSGEKAN